MSLLRSLRHRIVKTQERAVVGGLTICLPRNSQLPQIKKKFRAYDLALSEVSSAIETKYAGFRAIDIGANVGDTAALIRERSTACVLCIEGDSTVVPLLRANMSLFGSAVSIEPSFISTTGARIDPAQLEDSGRNACILGASDTLGSIATRTLNEILSDHPEFLGSKLLKIDTEGCDFDILRQAESYISHAQPVIFFEYAPHFRPKDPDAGLRALARLTTLGYSKFIYYDNFGNLLAAVSSDRADLFRQFHEYLDSNHRFGTAVYYFDICAFHEVDENLAARVQGSRLGAQALSLYR